MIFEKRKYDRLPKQLQPGAKGYIDRGQRVGHFLTGVLCNDFKEAFARADSEVIERMKDVAMWLYNDIPSCAHGSPRKVRAWIQAGGVEGIEAHGGLEIYNAALEDQSNA